MGPILTENGSVAEWLGRALQKLLQQFESARNLAKEHNCVQKPPLAAFLFAVEEMRALLAIDEAANKARADAVRPGCTRRCAFKPPKSADHRRRLSESEADRRSRAGRVSAPMVICWGPQDVAQTQRTA